MSNKINAADNNNNNKRLIRKLIIGVVFMFGFAYMLVPLYSLVCSQLGINGQAPNRAVLTPKDMQVDKSRKIKVEFSASIHGDLGFDFRPLQHSVWVHPGQTKLIYFYAKNNTGHGITVQAIPSITPDEDARYLKKTQCFCFTQQYFFTGEKADMPVYFFINPNIPKDQTSMTLSYTMFDVSKFLKKQEHYSKGRIEL